ncbi:MAG TPA: hypothetical protein VFE13_09930 [Caulobacteraceae bacterium]|jgi:hypothetical protein|nr:hypothetical protein [Caulobacteraceae bacterium]
MAADYGGVVGPHWYASVAARIVAETDQAPWVAVLHSGAGGFAPAIAAVAKRLAGFVFMDAVLPYPGRSWRETAPPSLAVHLDALTDDGLLAPWNRWFGGDVMARLLPDAAQRTAFIADLPRVPVSFLDAVSPDLTEWERIAAAYLRLSDGYEAEAAEADRRVWPTARTRMHHLAMITDPDKVAALLTKLISSFASR